MLNSGILILRNRSKQIDFLVVVHFSFYNVNIWFLSYHYQTIWDFSTKFKLLQLLAFSVPFKPFSSEQKNCILLFCRIYLSACSAKRERKLCFSIYVVTNFLCVSQFVGCSCSPFQYFIQTKKAQTLYFIGVYQKASKNANKNKEKCISIKLMMEHGTYFVFVFSPKKVLYHGMLRWMKWDSKIHIT